MAKKTSYTNADLKTGGPATEYGPWTQTEAGKKRYEDIVGTETLDDILSDTKRFLTKPTVVGDADRARFDQQNFEAEQRARQSSSLMGQLADDPTDTLMKGAMGLSVVPGGVGAAASVPLFASSMKALLDDPSLTSAAGVALSAIQPARFAKSLIREASPSRLLRHAWPQGKGPGAGTGIERMPQGPKPAGWGRSSPGQTGQIPGRPQRALPPGQGQLPPARSSMDALLEDTPDIPYEVVPDAPVAQGPGTMSEIDALIQSMADVRPSKNFVHPADRSGAMFGFDDLPEISEAELRALQQRWGGRK